MGKRDGQFERISALCPFYKKESKQVIYCEGFIEDSSLHFAFGNSLDCSKYKKFACCQKYTACPIYRMLEML